MVYLVKLDSAYKIGYSKDVKNRMKSFKTSNLNVELISFREGSMRNEQELHKALIDYNLRNELYEINDDIKNLFNTFIFDSQIDYKIEIDKLKKENTKLKEDNVRLSNELEKKEQRSEIKPEQKYIKEILMNGKLYSIDIIKYKDYILFGDSLSYKLSDCNFYNIHGTFAKIYTVSGRPMYYVQTGLAIPIVELEELVNKILKK